MSDWQLDLDADFAPLPPQSMRQPVIGIRVYPHTRAWMIERATAEGCTMNAFVNQLIDRERDGGLPADCRNWLARVAAQNGMPGQPDAALVEVLRRLAARYPAGCRLR